MLPLTEANSTLCRMNRFKPREEPKFQKIHYLAAQKGSEQI